MKRIIKIYKSKIVRFSGNLNSCLTSLSKIPNAIYGKGHLNDEEVQCIEKKLDTLHKQGEKCLSLETENPSKNKLQIDFLSSQEIVLTKLLLERNGFSKKEYNQIKGIIDGRRRLIDDIDLIFKIDLAIKDFLTLIK